jgi:parallel beta-helix repeat protein
VKGNLAAGNAPHGFAVFDSNHTLSGNIAIDNALGFTIADGSTNILLTGNAALGNLAPGVLIGGGATGVTNVSVIKGSIFGNDNAANCGLQNDSSSAINATGNFWGAMTGPGPDPADLVCDTGGGTTTFAPFATREVNPRSP